MDTERIFWPILAEKVAELSKLDSQFQWRLLGASLLQNLQIVIFLNFERKYFGWLSKKVSGAFKLLSTSPWEQFQENFFEKFLQLLWTFFGSFPVIGQEKPLSDCQNCIHCIYKIILKKKLFWQTNENFHHF